MAAVEENLKESIISQGTEENIGDDSYKKPSGGKASMNSVMFGMMASAMGTGIFNLPLRVTEVGLIMFIIYVLLSCLFSFLGTNMLKELVTKLKFESYSETSESASGSVLKRLSQVCLILFPWGIAVCFQVILVKFCLQLLADVLDCDLYSDREAEVYNSTGTC